MKKHHRKIRQRMRVITAETLAMDKAERSRQRALKAAETVRKKNQALADAQNQIFFKAYNLKTPQEQTTYLRLRSTWADICVQRLIDDRVITASQCEADLAFHLDFLPPPSPIEPAFLYALAVSSF